jgi:retron-type reverse transcriptase
MDTNVSAAPVKILRKWGEDYTAARSANMIAPLFLAPCFKEPINHYGYGFKLSGMW